VALRVPGPDIGPGTNKQFHDVLVILTDRIIEWGQVIIILDVDRGIGEVV
jgi:hypothetical protein